MCSHLQLRILSDSYVPVEQRERLLEAFVNNRDVFNMEVGSVNSRLSVEQTQTIKRSLFKISPITLQVFFKFLKNGSSRYCSSGASVV